MTESLSHAYIESHPDAAAAALLNLDKNMVADYLSALEPALTAIIIGQMDSLIASKYLTLIDLQKTSSIVSMLPLEKQLTLLPKFEKKIRREILTLLPDSIAAILKQRLRYNRSMVGAYMESRVLTLSADQTVSQAAQLLRSFGTEVQQTIFVLDADQHVIGIVKATHLIMSAQDKLIKDIMLQAPHPFSARTSIRDIRHHAIWDQLNVIPVVERGGVFCGFLTRNKMLSAIGSDNAPPATGDLSAITLSLVELLWVFGASLLTGDQTRSEDKS